MTRRPKPPAVTTVPSDVAGVQGNVTLNTPATWLAFGYLLIVGVLLAFFKTLILVAAALIAFVIGWCWFARRFPLAAAIIVGLMRGLCSRR
jgi:4-hydroxybenzoate polyprenyltransferase